MPISIANGNDKSYFRQFYADFILMHIFLSHYLVEFKYSLFSSHIPIDFRSQIMRKE